MIALKIAAAYIRVSTDDQTELSPDSQIKQIREYARTHDYIVPDELVFRDDGISGRSARKRPDFNRMIGTAKIKPKPFEAILLWKFSRFARNREDSIVYKSMLRKLGIDVISISEPTGDDKMSVLIEAMIEAMDEYYSINLAEEVKRGMLEKLSRGKCVNSAPIGYTFKDGELVIDDEKAEIVRRVYQEYSDGVTMKRIAEHLNADGLKTTHGNKYENRTVEYILRNPLYAGKLRYTPGKGSQSHYHNDKETIIVNGNHEPIIEPKTWEAIQEKIKANRAKYPKYQRGSAVKHELMLRGLLKCSSCGGTLVHGAGGYQCYKYAHGQCGTSHYITVKNIDKAVIDSLTNLDVNGDINITTNKERQNVSTDHIDKLIKREYMKLDRIKEAYMNGIDTLEEYKANNEKVSADIKKLENRKTKLLSAARRDNRDPREIIDEKRKEFLKLLENPETTQESLNSSLRGFVDKVSFDRAKTKVTIFYYC